MRSCTVFSRLCCLPIEYFTDRLERFVPLPGVVVADDLKSTRYDLRSG